MSVSNDVFLLIKSLTGPEKRHFKLNRKYEIKRTNNYMRLFEEIDEQSEYDEERILKKFKGEKFIKHLSWEKNYLFNLILKSLRVYHSDRTIDSKLKGLVEDIRLLYEKELYVLCAKKVKKAKLLAANHERFLVRLELLHWQRKVLKYCHFGDMNMEKISQERNKVLELIKAESMLFDLYDELLLTLKGSGYNSEDINQGDVEQLISHPVLKQNAVNDSFNARRHYLAIYSMYYSITGDHGKANLYAEKLVLLWEKNKHRIQEDPSNFKTTIYNYLVTCIRIGRVDTFPDYIAKAKKYPAISIKEKALDFQNFVFLELLHYLNTGDFYRAIGLVPEVESGIREYRSLISDARFITFYYNVSILYFIKQDFEKVLKWTEKILRERLKPRQDIQNFIRLLQLVAHYECSESTVVQYVYDGVYRYFKKRNLITNFERRLFKLIKKLNVTVDKDKEQQLLRKFIEASEYANEQRIGYEEIFAWAKSKLEHRTMEEIMKERVGEELVMESTTG